jgi:hypothetical protein
VAEAWAFRKPTIRRSKSVVVPPPLALLTLARGAVEAEGPPSPGPLLLAVAPFQPLRLLGALVTATNSVTSGACAMGGVPVANCLPARPALARGLKLFDLRCRDFNRGANVTAKPASTPKSSSIFSLADVDVGDIWQRRITGRLCEAQSRSVGSLFF